MTTAEPVIPTALLQDKGYDVFHCVNRSNGFISSTDVKEPFRVKIVRIEGLPSHYADLSVTISLCYLGDVLGLPLTSSHSSAHVWDEWAVFPIDVCDVPLDSLVTCTVCNVDGIVGGSSFHPFTSRGELKSGLRKQKLHMGKEADPSERSTTLGHIQTKSWDRLARDHAQGKTASVPWLDVLSSAKLDELNQQRQQKIDYAVLHIEFPCSSNLLPIFHISVPPNFNSHAKYYTYPPSPFVPVPDMDIRLDNLSELKAATLSKSLHLINDSNAQPSFKQHKQIMAIIARPPIRLDVTKVDDASLLWQFRYFLLKHPTGFVPFMQCVDWSNKGESSEAQKLIPLWKPIPPGDAIILLSKQFYPVRALRDYAINVLSRQSDTQLNLLLLQLVQAVRYDVNGELARFLFDRSHESWDMCSNLFWYLCVESDLETKSTGVGQVKNWNKIQDEGGALYTNLRQKLLDEVENANKLFYFRLRGQENLRTVLIQLYTTVYKDPRDRVKKIKLLGKLIEEQQCGLRECFDPNKSVLKGTVTLPTHPHVCTDGISTKGIHMFKSAKMPIKLPFLVCESPEVPDLEELDPNALPYNEVSEEATPQSKPRKSPTPPPDLDVAGDNASPVMSPVAPPAASHAGREILDVMFKCGDDVRQDQLVIQFITLIDSLWKESGLDLCLTPYRVLATSSNDGFMEMVPHVTPFQDIRSGGIVKHIQKYNVSNEDFTKAMDRFVKSCAGYCVITFLLGIGDRHLENLLVTDDGRLLHIDFGFILGNDPKPFPPPMKINKEMVEGFGGVNSTGYQQFKEYCCTGYNTLRRHASLLLNLLLLMVDAQIPHLSGDGSIDPRINLIKVQDKLRLDLNNAQAMQYLQGVIADSVGAVFTNWWDVLHEAVQAARH